MKNKYILIFFILMLLPAIFMRDYAVSNELRYLSIVDEALRDNHFFTFTLNGQPYADKPPLFFWCIMLGKVLLGSHYMWFVSLFSLAPAIIIMLIMDKWIKAEMSYTYRNNALLMLMTSFLYLGLSVFVRMDMLFSLFILLSLYYFYRIYREIGSINVNTWLFPIFIFLAVFTKGPLGFLIPLLSTIVFLALEGRIKTLFLYWGGKTWIILLSACAIWFFAVWWEGGSEYLKILLFHQTIDRAIDAFHHKEPFYFYLISYWYSFAPWSLFVAGIIISAMQRRMIRSVLQHFFLVIIITTFVLLSVISSKLPVYMMPVFPFVIYLAVSLTPAYGWNRKLALTLALPFGLLAFTFPIFCVATFFTNLAYLRYFWFYAASAFLSISAIISLIFLYRRKSVRVGINIFAIGMLITLFIGSWSIPDINSYIGYKALCDSGISIAKQTKTKGYCIYHVRRSEGLKVFLPSVPKEVTIEDILNNRCKGNVLFLPLKEMESSDKMINFFDRKDCRIVGKYVAVGL